MNQDRVSLEYSLFELQIAVDFLINHSKGKKVWLFYAQMGAGKTTLITAICKYLGVENEVQSPTYAIINEYEGAEKVYHLDLYRLKSVQEAQDIGIDDYLYSSNYCLIEWPQVIKDILPDNCLHIFIEIKDENKRVISLNDE